MYWILAMIILAAYRVSQGKSPIPTKEELAVADEGSVNPAFSVEK